MDLQKGLHIRPLQLNPRHKAILYKSRFSGSRRAHYVAP